MMAADRPTKTVGQKMLTTHLTTAAPIMSQQKEKSEAKSTIRASPFSLSLSSSVDDDQPMRAHDMATDFFVTIPYM